MFGNKAKEDKRFEIVHAEGAFEGCKIIVDKETGVNYILAFSGNAGGLTVLVDKDGKPITTEFNPKDEVK